MKNHANHIDRLTDLASEPDIAFVAGVTLGSFCPAALLLVGPAVLGYRLAKHVMAEPQPTVVVDAEPLTDDL